MTEHLYRYYTGSAEYAAAVAATRGVSKAPAAAYGGVELDDIELSPQPKRVFVIGADCHRAATASTVDAALLKLFSDIPRRTGGVCCQDEIASEGAEETYDIMDALADEIASSDMVEGGGIVSFFE